MACPRCGTENNLVKTGWCKPCEYAFDGWVRRYASDIIWSTMSGGLVLAMIGMGLPLLGLGWVVAATGAFASFGTIVGVHKLVGRKRRRQFLRGEALPRAYLPPPVKG